MTPKHAIQSSQHTNDIIHRIDIKGQVPSASREGIEPIGASKGVTKAVSDNPPRQKSMKAAGEVSTEWTILWSVART